MHPGNEHQNQDFAGMEEVKELRFVCTFAIFVSTWNFCSKNKNERKKDNVQIEICNSAVANSPPLSESNGKKRVFAKAIRFTNANACNGNSSGTRDRVGEVYRGPSGFRKTM